MEEIKNDLQIQEDFQNSKHQISQFEIESQGQINSNSYTSNNLEYDQFEKLLDEKNQTNFNINLQKVQQHRNTNRIAKCICRKRSQTQVIRINNVEIRQESRVPKIHCKRCCWAPNSSIFQHSPVVLFHQFMLLTIKMSLQPLLIVPLLILGLCDILTQFNHSQIGYQILLILVVSFNSVYLINYWMLKRSEFKKICAQKVQAGPQLFTILLYKIPQSQDQNSVRQRYLASDLQSGARIHQPFFSADFLKGIKKIVNLKRQQIKTKNADRNLSEDQFNKKNCCGKRKFRKLRQIQSELKTVQTSLDQYKSLQNFKLKQQLTFITLNSQEQSKLLFKSWNICKCRKSFARRAPPPKDVYWQNLHENTIFLQLIFSLAALGFVVLVGILLYFVQKWQSQVDKDDYVLIALTSFIIFFADVISQYLLKVFTRREKHHSLTQAQIYFAYKLIVLNTIVTIILPNVVYREPSKYFDSNNLFQEILLSLCLFSFLSPFSYFFNAYYWWRYYKYCRLRCKLRARNSSLSLLTVKQAERLSQLGQFQFSKRYAQSLIPLLLSSYYVIILPIGVVIAGIGMAFNHVITVWQWITFYRRPGHLSPRIARHFVNVLILSPLMMIIGTTSACILLPDFDTRFHVPIFYIFSGFCVLAISIGYKCVTNSLSNGQQIRCCNKCQDWIIWFFHGSRQLERQETDNGTQPKSKKIFDQSQYWDNFNDYVFQDPIYNQKAMMKMLQKKQNQENDQNRQQEIRQIFGQTARKGFFGSAVQQMNRTLYDRENDIL